MNRWDGLSHVLWDGVFTVVFLAALVATLRDPVWRLKQGWLGRGGALFFALALVIGTGGYILPVGARRRNLRANRTGAAASS